MVSARKEATERHFRITEEIKITWCRRIDGGYTAFADEAKAGYEVGEKVGVIPGKLTNMPSIIHVLPKTQSHV